MKRKRSWAIIMAVIMTFMLMACGQDNTEETPEKTTVSPATDESGQEKEESEEIVIGWSLPSWTAFNAGMDEYMQKQAEKYDNLTLHTVCAEGDATKQIADIEDLMSKGCQLIMVKAVDETTISNVLKQAQDEGIIVMLVQRTMQTENYDYFVGAEMVSLGRMMGEYIISQLPDQGFNYCVLAGQTGSSTNLDLIQGVEEVFAETGRDDIVKLAEMNSNDSRAETKEITEDWITAYGEDIDVIFAANDESLMGAVQATTEAGLDQDIVMCACNATAEILPYLKDGTVNMTFALAPGVFPGLEMAIDILEGNGDQYQSWYEIPCFPVTTENVDLYYDDCIEQDVYMVGLLSPETNPLYENLDELFPELVPLLEYSSQE